MSISVEFSADELALVRHSLKAFLSDFGHEEKDVVRRIQDLLARLPEPAPGQPAQPTRSATVNATES